MKISQSFLLIILVSTINFAQPEKGNVGVSAQIQSQQVDFLIPFFVNDNLSFSPAVGLISISDKYLDLSLGMVIRYHFLKEIVTPFVGARFGGLFYIPKENDTITDIVFGPLFGGEYYFSKNFSVGIELQLNVTLSGENSLRFGNPDGTNINTATAFFATIYF